ncbi:alpha-amylase family glycosyl hydrolase [Psychroflexus planctonicus]|uniref:Alpha-amlyase n=1 Tax=Psychroflexus planctonicus TaxID=1526575 RepID=A0ABQ1SE43_9FLAO|nr:alpha-amylase family glycosyl hydrolase [Psychroflexus planctonicus]GGE32762.1 alpha-amlyase [Psychroflexus planctonicus]
MKKLLSLGFCILLLASCADEKKEEARKPLEKEEQSEELTVTNDALESAVIYEANIRQYSPEGTFEAFTKDIPQLKELGVKVIWLMPIYPISMTNRKATPELSIEDIEDEEEKKKYLGSYYAISDYTAVNPEFGNMEDLEKLVETAHENDMYVILDWVANHTGWDHHWIDEHPEYYVKNKDGEITDPMNKETGETWGWTDTAHLEYDNPDLHEAMKNEMKFWVEEKNIDGFRCDVAGEVPTAFWEMAVKELESIKPVFMLAESEDKDLFHEAFDMGYNWEGHHLKNEIAQGKKTVKAWDDYMVKIDSTYQKDDYLMNFVTNHDENSWNGTIKERMGDAAEMMTAFAYTIPGMPLIYSGQEYDMSHRLKFFEKDSIPKEKGEMWSLLEKLGGLKSSNVALHGAKEAADYKRILTSDDSKILAFKRVKNGEEVIFIANMTSNEITFSLDLEGNYTDYITGEEDVLIKGAKIVYPAWGYQILVE